MAYKEVQQHIPEFCRQDVFRVGSRIGNIPKQTETFGVSFEEGALEIAEGVAVYAQIDNIEFLGSHGLSGFVEQHDAKSGLVLIELRSRLAEATLELSLIDNEEEGGTDIISALNIDVVGGGLVRRVVEPKIQPKVDRIMPKFARTYRGSVHRDLRNPIPQQAAA